MSAQTATIVTRFAPSPTGYLHVGGARTALFNWLLARRAGGRFLLRIEDTDLARSTPAAVDAVLDDLRWLGLEWDNPELVYQSKRLAIYDTLIDRLIAEGKAYRAYETPEELAAQRAQAERAKRPYLYRRPRLTDEQIRQFESEGRPHVVRLAMPVKEYRFDDAVLGPGQGVAPAQVQDFVIRKSDGMPTYHFAVVVDDHEMGITHVLRGQEHLLNTVNHIAIQEALGYPRPVWAHLPVILNVDGSKMSKRDRDKKVRHHVGLTLKKPGTTLESLAQRSGIDLARLEAWIKDTASQLEPAEHERLMPHVGLKPGDLPEILVHDFRENGYLPEVLNNFLALLGWSPGGDLERMSMAEMVERFDLAGVGKSNAKFNREKLRAFNTEACAAASSGRLLAAMRDYLAHNPASPLNKASDEMLAAILKAGAGFHILREVDEKSRFLLIDDDRLEYDRQAVEKVLLKGDRDGEKTLRKVHDLLESVDPWAADTLEAVLKRFCESTGLSLGKVAQPIRVAVSGGTVSPPIFDTLVLLGRERTLGRIRWCLQTFGRM